MNKILKVYRHLYSLYGAQGWWPLVRHKGENPTKTGSIKGYHPGDYSYPKDENQKYEICVGAILAQNTSWINAERALINLDKEEMLKAENILKINKSKIAQLIKPAGFFNQKTKKIIEFSKFFLKLNSRIPTRKELLEIWGIGPETADSILLYAYKQPIFVVDTYTRRIFAKLKMIDADAKYENIQKFFQRKIEPDYRVYQEFHALIVEHAKRNKLNK